MIDVVMPQLGEDIAEATVSQWLVRVGDAVVKDQPLLEVETSKADVEIPSPTNGVVEAIVAAVGATVAKGDLLCRIDETRTG
ncbi:Biotin-requiring enzyme [Nannocystis exedens]|uniref:Biotin-requiring enzyme n=2 Tax=Nannocystis exedens TaxID=54 RepID=A0A1I2BFU2_9BACT|nr:biotin/lipoyl-containing protein [Nannocystis exedens]SFE54748.1 Biotin-requiring enzyme [Nannocystis exedens]